MSIFSKDKDEKNIFWKNGWSEVLGMNARNARIQAENPPRAIRLVNSKLATKRALEDACVPVTPTLLTVRDRRDLRDLDWETLPDGWALKPDWGRRGAGILLAAGRDGKGWLTPSGRSLGKRDVADHLRFILEGEFSSAEAEEDSGFFEPLIRAHPTLAKLVPSGLPDVRLIRHSGGTLMAMVRLPTKDSGGRANLHQQAIGAAVDLESGRITRAMRRHETLEDHPDTSERLVGVEIPDWDGIMDAAARCETATGLSYLGADVVLDEERGPLVMEVNARPGLEIQNVSGTGLKALLDGGIVL